MDTTNANVPFRKDSQMLARLEKATYESININELPKMQSFPKPTWRRSRRDYRGRAFPNAIAHRGNKIAFPENSMAAMRSAVGAGAIGIETDIHLSRDGVVVLSHDKDLGRCFGIDKKVIDCDWDYLSTLRSTRAPGEPLARLEDLLEYLAQPDLDHVWLLLDIKTDNEPDTVMRLVAKTINTVTPSQRPWSDRIVLGCWTAQFVPLCAQHLPGFPITHIGASICYARQFLDVPNCAFNMFYKACYGPFGRRFMNKVKNLNRDLFLWTVNDPNIMKWAIQQGVQGVITDNPKLFNDICDSWQDDEPPVRFTWRECLMGTALYLFVGILMTFFRVKQYLSKRRHLQIQAHGKEAHGVSGIY